MNYNSYNELFSQAQMAFVSEKYDFAISKCREAIEFFPESVDSIALLGNIFLIQNKFVEAQDCFQKVIDLEPTVGEYCFNLGNSLFGQQRLAEAMQQYAKAIQLGCSDEMMQKIYYIVGVINQLDGKNAEALINYDKSNTIAGANVDRADILLKKIQIYVEQNNFDKAENCALQLKLLIPNEFKSYQLLFQLYLEQHKTEKASSVLDEAEECCEKNLGIVTEVTFDRAMLCCFQAEQYPNQQAVHYEEALRILSRLDNAEGLKLADKYEALITRADIYLKLERFDEACSIAKSVSNESLPELNEYVERAHYIIVKCLAHKKDFSGVQKYAAKLKKSENLFYRHYGYYAEAFAGKQIAGGSSATLSKYVGLYNYAIAYYKNCTVSMPGDFLAYLYRAKCYVDIGKFEKADELSRVLPADAQITLQDYIQQERRRWKN